MWQVFILCLFYLTLGSDADICSPFITCRACVVSNCIFYIHSSGNFCGLAGETRRFSLKIRRVGTCVSFAYDPLIVPTERSRHPTPKPYSLAWAEKPEEMISSTNLTTDNGVPSLTDVTLSIVKKHGKVSEEAVLSSNFTPVNGLPAVSNVSFSVNETKGIQPAEMFSTDNFTVNGIPAVLNDTVSRNDDKGLQSAAVASKIPPNDSAFHNQTDGFHLFAVQTFQSKVSAFICAQYMAVFQVLHPKRSIDKERQRCMRKMNK